MVCLFDSREWVNPRLLWSEQSYYVLLLACCENSNFSRKFPSKSFVKISHEIRRKEIQRESIFQLKNITYIESVVFRTCAKCDGRAAHTHTHTYIYIYIYIANRKKTRRQIPNFYQSFFPPLTISWKVAFVIKITIYLSKELACSKVKRERDEETRRFTN